MIIKFYSKTGVVRVEKEKGSYEHFEMPDGGHKLWPGGVYRDREMKRPPICIFIDGIVPALGSNPGVANPLDKGWSDINVSKVQGSRPHVSRLWSRNISAMLDKLGKYLPFIIIGCILLYAFYTSGGSLIGGAP